MQFRRLAKATAATPNPKSASMVDSGTLVVVMNFCDKPEGIREADRIERRRGWKSRYAIRVVEHRVSEIAAAISERK